MGFKQLPAILLAGLALRFILLQYFPTFSSILDNRPECTTPVSSFKRMQEGVFQYIYSGSPYMGGIFYQSPLLLALFSAIRSETSINVLYSVIDMLSALGMAKCAANLETRQDIRGYIRGRLAERERRKKLLGKEKQESDTAGKDKKTDQDIEETKKSQNKNENQVQEDNEEPPQSAQQEKPSEALKEAISVSPAVAAAFYLFNPFTLMGSLARSTQTMTNFATIWAIYLAIKRKGVPSLLMLALSSALGFYPIYLAPGLIVLAAGGAGAERNYIRLGSLFVAFVGLMLGLSYIPTGSWDFIMATYGTQLLFRDLTPNIGLWWYFFTEMFDFFRSFFLGVFQLYLASYSIPVALKFQSQPYFGVVSVLGLSAVFKSYPETSDVGLYFSLLILYRPILSLLRYQIVVVLALLYCGVLLPTFHHLWIYSGSGNSNFFYAITLVQALTMTLTISDSMWAAIRLDFDGGADSSVLQV